MTTTHRLTRHMPPHQSPDRKWTTKMTFMDLLRNHDQRWTTCRTAGKRKNRAKGSDGSGSRTQRNTKDKFVMNLKMVANAKLNRHVSLLMAWLRSAGKNKLSKNFLSTIGAAIQKSTLFTLRIPNLSLGVKIEEMLMQQGKIRILKILDAVEVEIQPKCKIGVKLVTRKALS